MAQLRQSGADRILLSGAGDPVAFRKHHARGRRRLRRRSPAAAIVLTLLVLILILVGSLFLLAPRKEIESGEDEDRERSGSGSGFLSKGSFFPRVLKFGRGSGAAGRDSRYWDRDDRRRDTGYVEEEVSEGSELGIERDSSFQKSGKRDEVEEKQEEKVGSGRLYNEGGRAELDLYSEEFEASLKNDGEWGGEDRVEVNRDDEYDDGIDVEYELNEERNDGGDNSGGGSSGGGDVGNSGNDGSHKDEGFHKDAEEKDPMAVSRKIGRGRTRKEHSVVGGKSAKSSRSEKKTALKKKPRHRFSSSTCEMKFLNSTAQIVEPVQTKKFARFSLQYADREERPSDSEKWEPRFAGHQSLQEREESYHARDQKINCGFVKGPVGLPSTGFDIEEDDVKFMSSCHIAVASCIFGNSDHLRTPYTRTVTKLSRKNVCFVMFVDENTLQTLVSEGQKMDTAGYIGLWKIIVVKNLPSTDMRRVGKIPKFLAHRLFTSARYSIWLDSKLRLQKDPLLILEYFLWRRGYEYAISNHYDRHCVWEEVMQNKKLNKFNHTIIDQQFEFYQADGLKKFDPSDPNMLLPSYVPEGSFIVRAHTPMSNLFSCLWFNEVDRFTPRDQLSFAYTYLKLRRMNPGKSFHLNMFKDCERRSIAKLYHHRAEDKRTIPTSQ